MTQLQLTEMPLIVPSRKQQKKNHQNSDDVSLFSYNYKAVVWNDNVSPSKPTSGNASTLKVDGSWAISIAQVYFRLLHRGSVKQTKRRN